MNKTEKLQRYLKHAEEDVEKLTTQLDEQKAMVTSLESEKGQLSRQLSASKSGWLFHTHTSTNLIQV